MPTLSPLHELGSEGLYYTQSQVREIIQYASAQGIRVVPGCAIPPKRQALTLLVKSCLQAHQPPPAAWAAAQRTLLKRASEHTELVDFVVLEPLKELLEATERP